MALPGRGARPKNTLPLLTSTVKMDAEDPSMRCCFRVVSPSGTYTLQAESEFERAEWIAALQVSTAGAASTHSAKQMVLLQQV
jgi:Arf-GAP/coiled-coil/ANK repeat/PH domain-containing protein